MKQVLVLGAGLVAKPLVRYLLEQPDIFVLVASRTQSKADALIDGHPDGRTASLDVQDNKSLENMVAKSNLVISLLPYTYHVLVARYCLQHKVHLVTTSYVSSEMNSLDKAAKEKGLLFLNEIGLDPGIDHMSAMKIIHDVKARSGEIVEFESCCGGLPAPDANDNPFGYKFSWSPKGVVMAGRNPAEYLKDGKEIKIRGEDLFENNWLKEVKGLGQLEVYPNRDSMLYQSLYGLDNIKTLFRGTFRYSGWCETLLKIVQLGYLDDNEKPELQGKSFAEVTAFLIGSDKPGQLRNELAQFLGLPSESSVIDRLEWLGLFSGDPVKAEPVTLLNILATRMLEKMPYKKTERDMIVLQHDFMAKYPDGKKEKICSLLIDYGIVGGDSAMARTVSLPAAIAAKLIMQEKIPLTGVHIPVQPEIYEPVLAELEQMGIKFKESVLDIE